MERIDRIQECFYWCQDWHKNNCGRHIQLAPTFDDFIKCLTCQLQVCLSQNLSLSLKKCLFCPERMEFVRHDVCTNDNRPAQSKHSLLKSWPVFKIARDVSSLLGFMNFYATYIPWFEERAAPLRE